MRGQTNRKILGPKLQRRLRNAPTDAERKLWQALRSRQIDGCKFRRQHPYYAYVLDFVCIERKLVIEVDGGQHADSISDEERDIMLAKDGFRVLRFWNNEVLMQLESVVEAIYLALREQQRQQHHPHPSPPLEGEGEKLEVCIAEEKV